MSQFSATGWVTVPDTELNGYFKAPGKGTKKKVSKKSKKVSKKSKKSKKKKKKKKKQPSRRPYFAEDLQGYNAAPGLPQAEDGSLMQYFNPDPAIMNYYQNMFADPASTYAADKLVNIWN
jgi:hypothetical protein